ncbi:MAG: hypothetical protein JO257_37720 [Deltaproteobacteria bacterium]|nr:hypothetical protein [Deltaproteobacteria bacterium]
MRNVVLALVLAVGVAQANGRPPISNGIFFRPGDAHSLYLRTTFGLLISHDDGCTFDWVCEQNVGYGGMFDPKYAIATDGTIFATTFTGLRVSHDGGCSFSNVGPTVWIDAIDIGPTGEVWIGTAESGQPNDVYSSTNNGAEFASKGMQSPSIWWKSVKVAPSNAQRVYIAGYQVAGPLPDGGQMPPTAHVLRSDNDGTSWTPSPLTGVMYGSTPVVIVAAVDPQNADEVFLISNGANPPNGDRLYRSTDGAMTWTEVLATTDPIRDVVIRDATTVLAATQTGGSFKSTNAGASFTAMNAPPQLECLGQRSDGTLIGCGANWEPDFMSVTKSTDGGQSWQKVWRFVEIHGPLQCPDGTTEHDTCELGYWPNLAMQFGATGPTCGANAGKGTWPPTVDGPPAGDPPPKKKTSGCCDAGEGAPVGALWAFALVLWLRRGRRGR